MDTSTSENGEFTSQASEVVNRYALLAPAVRAGFIPYLPEYDAGVDFILYRERDDLMLKVQLKSRWTVDQKYLGRRIWIAFPLSSDQVVEWFLAPHDLMVRHGKARHGDTGSWKAGAYHKPRLGSEWRSLYEGFEAATLLRLLTPARSEELLGDIEDSWS